MPELWEMRTNIFSPKYQQHENVKCQNERNWNDAEVKMWSEGNYGQAVCITNRKGSNKFKKIMKKS